MKEIITERTLVLIDQVEEVVLDGGAIQRMETDVELQKDRKLINALEDSLGEHRESWHRIRPERGSLLGGNTSHQFGGHDVLNQTVDIIFALGSAGIAKHAFATLQTWLQAKKGRKAVIEEKVKGGKTRRIEMTGYSERQVRRLLKANKEDAA
jgi:hypothetical protein